jgi:hypothetical protein
MSPYSSLSTDVSLPLATSSTFRERSFAANASSFESGDQIGVKRQALAPLVTCRSSPVASAGRT